MNVITHLLAGWTLAEQTRTDPRDANLIAWAALAPDADGLGAVVDGWNHFAGRQSFLFGTYHHVLLHGALGALVVSLALCLRARDRVRVFLWSLLTFHLHLACDLVGSRGPDPADIWPIHYLGPFSGRMTFEWSHQWALNAWPNIVFTIALMAYAFVRAVRAGRSPVALLSARADVAFVETVRRRWWRLAAS